MPVCRSASSRLLLIRHGRTTANVDRLLDTAYPGASLDELGRAQAEDLVARLSGESIEAIYVSDLVRTAQTADPLARARGIEPVTLAGLREIQAGEYELSADWGPFVQAVSSWWTETPVAVPGGDSREGFLSRFDAAVATAARHETAVVVTHGAALRTWVGLRCPGLPPELVAAGSIPNTMVAVVEGAPETGWTLRSWGDQAF